MAGRLKFAKLTCMGRCHGPAAVFYTCIAVTRKLTSTGCLASSRSREPLAHASQRETLRAALNPTVNNQDFTSLVSLEHLLFKGSATCASGAFATGAFPASFGCSDGGNTGWDGPGAICRSPTGSGGS